ncbi:MAG: Gfo/Idh/MocA family oxidoreductase [Chloroflexi bacterium]|nr:Gfo/Idh/MocA family oxidoreductase [Chloroflexota bacterium]
MAKKVLYLFKQGDFHMGEAGGKLLTAMLASSAPGEFEIDMSADLDALARLPESNYAAVVVYTTGLTDDLTAPREQGLFSFVRNGGGFVGIHSATDSFRGNRAYVSLVNGEFETHPAMHEFPVEIVNPNHYMTVRMPGFSVVDEMYHLKSHDPARCTLLAQTYWQGKQMPMVYTRTEGKGRVAYIALGHSEQAWQHPEFNKLLLRGLRWVNGADLTNKVITAGLWGYGGAFNMGKGHAGWMDATPGMKTIAMCDMNPARVEAAKQELPNLEGYFTNPDDLLAMKDLDLIIVILPHNLHCDAVVKCLRAGKHAITEKPFCTSVAEANAMVNASRETGKMLSVFHNRRWDGDYVTIRDVIRRGLIGDIFHVEAGGGGYNRPGTWWRSDKAISGGVMFDWGAHFLDWILNMVPGKVTQVTGDFQKRVWHHVTNEDHGEVWIRFDSGATVDYIESMISASSRPKWRIQGTKGAIMMDKNDEIQVVSYASGIRQNSTVKWSLPGYGSVEYYRNVADHLLMGEELAVTGEQARRVIAVIEAGMESSKLGKSVPVAEGCE